MNPQQRGEWILNWIKKRCLHGEAVDVLYSDFVYDYIGATGAKHELMMYGAPKCKQLGKDLSALHTLGYLSRCTTGLSPGDSAMGFPKWVYSYRIKD